MSKKLGRKLVAGAGAAAMAAGLAVTMGAGAANAAPGTADWWDGNTGFVRTIDNVNPSAYEIITVTTEIKRAGGPIGVQWFQQVKDIHPACFEYVQGSAKADGKPANVEAVDETSVKVTGNWDIYPIVEPHSKFFEFSYTVLPGCERGVELGPSTTHYASGNYQGNYDMNKGPFVTVKPTPPTIPGLPGSPGGMGSLGPLSNLFGSLGS